MYDTPLEVKKIPAGKRIDNPQPGDFFLVHRDKLASRVIEFGQRLRFTKDEAYWNHAGAFLDDKGTIIEALVKSGVTEGHISKYDHTEYIVVRIRATDEDRQQMVKYLEWTKGQEYGRATIVSLSFWCIFGGKIDFSIDCQDICSGVVAAMTERAGIIYDSNAQRVPPAGLARHWRVHEILGNKPS